ncbi:MAG: hypothetical protein ACREEM_08685, partial [Blastocatellia bacterium]
HFQAGGRGAPSCLKMKNEKWRMENVFRPGTSFVTDFFCLPTYPGLKRLKAILHGGLTRA